MRSTQMALRFCFAAVAGALAASIAHVVIDVAGDYLLARDSYDGIVHHSRALLPALAALVLVVVAIRIVCDAIDRRCSSTTSMLAAVREALGHPAAFVFASAALAVAVLAAMEYFDCLLASDAFGLDDLFGGSIFLGAGTALALGAVSGWITYRCVRLAAQYEAPIAAFIVSILKLALQTPVAPPLQRGIAPAGVAHYALVLARQGRRRGPPFSVFG